MLEDEEDADVEDDDWLPLSVSVLSLSFSPPGIFESRLRSSLLVRTCPSSSRSEQASSGLSVSSTSTEQEEVEKEREEEEDDDDDEETEEDEMHGNGGIIFNTVSSEASYV